MGDETEPLPPSYQRLQELMRARVTGHHSHVLSDPEMEWLCWTALILGIAFVTVAVWSHHGAARLRPKKLQRFRSHTKRRPKRRKRHRK
jgi:hypothetical protein